MRSWKERPRWQRIATIVAMVIVALAAALWIASRVLRPRLPTQAQVVTQARAQARLTGGARVFATHCAYCHERGIGPALGGRGLDSAAIATFVRAGPGAMPAFPVVVVSDADIDAVARHLATLPAAGTAK